MTPEVARAVLAEPVPSNNAGAARVIRAWLLAGGWRATAARDAYEPAVQGARRERYQIGAKVLRRQYRNDRGEWVNARPENPAVLDAALQLRKKAAEALGQTELVAAVAAAKDARKLAKQGAREKRDLGRYLALALRAVGRTERAAVGRWVLNRASPTDGRAIEQAALVEADRLLATGESRPATDEAAASLDAPPFLALANRVVTRIRAPNGKPVRVTIDGHFFWNENLDGELVTIEMYGKQPGACAVQIGGRYGETAIGAPNSLINLTRTRHGGQPVLRGALTRVGDGSGGGAKAVVAQLQQLAPGLFGWSDAEEEVASRRAMGRLSAAWCRLLRGFDLETFRMNEVAFAPAFREAFEAVFTYLGRVDSQTTTWRCGGHGGRQLGLGL